MRSYFSNNLAHGKDNETNLNYTCMTSSRVHAKTHARAKGGHADVIIASVRARRSTRQPSQTHTSNYYILSVLPA